MAERTIELAPGESSLVSFEAVPAEARSYQVLVNGLEGSFSAMPAFYSETDDLSDLTEISTSGSARVGAWTPILNVASGGCRFLGGQIWAGGAVTKYRVTVDGGIPYQLARVRILAQGPAGSTSQYFGIVPPIKADTSLKIELWCTSSYAGNDNYVAIFWARAL
ncbi:unnamed protein product [marine sediment metagenome]|uniref:Uncharacterized protein n=1 Tax=marine sediment metagenome TaxID=412755 RepID=X1PVA6_9ZZZZ